MPDLRDGAIVTFFHVQPKLTAAECLIKHQMLFFLLKGEENVAQIAWM
jgi:hypothetical protein